MTLLKWWTGSNGNAFADFGGNRYCVAIENGPLGRFYRVAVNGRSLGGSNVKELAIKRAEEHAALPKKLKDKPQVGSKFLADGENEDEMEQRLKFASRLCGL